MYTNTNAILQLEEGEKPFSHPSPRTAQRPSPGRVFWMGGEGIGEKIAIITTSYPERETLCTQLTHFGSFSLSELSKQTPTSQDRAERGVRGGEIKQNKKGRGKEISQIPKCECTGLSRITLAPLMSLLS